MPGSFSPAKSIFTGFTRLPGLSADKRYGLRTRALLLVAVTTMYAKNMPWYGKKHDRREQNSTLLDQSTGSLAVTTVTCLARHGRPTKPARHPPFIQTG